MSQGSTAFVPGHVTAFFSVHRRESPAASGSRGAGVTLTDGVSVEVEPAEETSLTLDGKAIVMEPVDRVLSTLERPARVRASSRLPLGAGFGVSGAVTLGAALAANHEFGLEYSENDLVERAHVAEVKSGTGLGDVVAQARGDAPIRIEPGAPGHGVLDGVPETARLEWVSFGDLSTEEVIAGDTEDLSAAGESALSALRERPTLTRLFSLGETFARETDLLVPEVAEAIDAVETEGGTATMAMLGRTVVALGTGLTDAGYGAESCRVHAAGASLDGM